MKKVLLVFFVLFLALVVGIVVFIATFNPNRYRPLIIQKASEALGAPVDMGSLSLGWRNGVAVRLRDLVVYSNPSKSSAAAKLKEISATVKLMPLLNKELQISSIVLIDPQVHLARTPDGSVGLVGVKLPTPAAASQDSAKSPAAAALPVSFSINLFQVRNGFVWFEDPSSAPPLSVQIKNMDVDVKKFSLTEPFTFVARASLFSAAQNVQAEGTVTLPQGDGAGSVENAAFKTDLSQLNLAELGRTFPSAASAGIQEIKGVLETKLERFELGGAGRAKAALSLQDGRVKLTSSKSALDKLQLKAVLDGEDLRIDQFTADYAGGRLKAKGVVKQFRSQALSGFSWHSSDLAIDQMMPETGSGGPRLSGRLSTDLEGQAAGTAWPQISQTLSGQGQVTLKDGVLLNYNLLRTVVQKLSMVPGAEEVLRNNLPNIYRAKMNEPSTLLQPIQVPFVVQNGQIYFSQIDLVTDFIIVHGAGQVGFDKRVSMKTRVRLHQQLSQTIVSLVPQVQMVTNAQGEIEIPGQLQGVLPHVVFVPDGDYIAQKLLSSEAAQKMIKGFIENPQGTVLQARNLLDKPVAAGESGVQNSVAGLLGALMQDPTQTAGSGTGNQNQ